MSDGTRPSTVNQSRRRRRWVAGFAILAVTWFGSGAVGAFLVTAPAHRELPTRTALAGTPIRSVRLRAADGTALAGWYLDARTGRAVALFAGIRGDREALLDRARDHLRRGWSTLLVDLRGTGESEGDRISFGWHERHDVVAAYAWLRDNGVRTVAAHGVSLGAAAILYAADELDDLGFAILEMPYRDIDSALANRAPFVPWPEFTLWPVRFWGAVLLGVATERLAPIHHADTLDAPVLLLAGAAARRCCGSEGPTGRDRSAGRSTGAAVDHPRVVPGSGSRRPARRRRDALPRGPRRVRAAPLSHGTPVGYQRAFSNSSPGAQAGASSAFAVCRRHSRISRVSSTAPVRSQRESNSSFGWW